MSTRVAKIEAFRIESLPLEECLIELEKYGQPRVAKMRNGWYSCIEVFVTGEGVAFDVKSDHDNSSAKDAANQCYKRLTKALAQIKNGET